MQVTLRAYASSLTRRSRRRLPHRTSTSRPGGARSTRSKRRRPQRLALIHFGVTDDPGPHLEELRGRLDEWASDVLGGGLDREALERAPDVYGRAMPLWQSYAGLARYWDKTGVSAATSASR